MLRFAAGDCFNAVMGLATIQIVVDDAETGSNEKRTSIIQSFDAAAGSCRALGLHNLADRCKRARDYARANFDKPEGIAALANDLHEECVLMLDRIPFLYVVPARGKYLDNPAIFGPAVAQAFPTASKADLMEAGNCLAADCGTAAVFHLMRVVEWGLRAFATHLGFANLKRKKRGTNSYVPVPYSDWEHILTELQARVDKKLSRIRRGPRKQELQEFYYPALQEMRAIRDAWRNHVMHTRADYSVSDAVAIWGHVERLMTHLAARMKEV